MCAYTQEVSIVFTPHQGIFSLQQTEATTENYTQSKCRAVEPSPKAYMYKIISPKALGILHKRT